MAPKKKTEKMSLGTFLQDDAYGSWADEMEDMPLPSTDSRPTYGSDRRPFASMGMGNGMSDRRDGYPPREQLPLPTQPPYTAHLANLSFDAAQADIEEFFRDCEVTSVRIVEDKMDRKPKGFGYVEFGSLDGLKTALTLSGSSLQGRSIRISVAEPPKDRQESRDFSDWSRKGPLPDLPGAQRRTSDRNFGNRSFDNMSDAGSERSGRRAYEPSDGKVRDFSNWERRGPLPPAAGQAQTLRDGGRQMSRSKDGPANFRRNSPGWGEGRSQDGSRPPRREYTEKPPVERQPTAPELDNQWRARMQPDAPAKSPTPETSNPPSPRPAAAAAATPASRPKLNLQKRTVSEAVAPATSPSAGGEPKASPFGAARPVDTATKERELEEKRLLAIRQKKEAEDKARAEKAEEKRSVKEKPDAEKATPTSPKVAKDTPQAKENGEDAPPATPKFDILRRADSATNDMIAEDEQDEDAEVPAPTDDKAVKPKEVVVDAPAGQSNGSWRSKSQKQAETTAESMEEDGWSTVSKPTKQRNNRRNNMPTRALAS